MKAAYRWKIAQKAELRWWKQYLKDKDITKYISWKKEYWQRLLEKTRPFISLHSDIKIMDAACGPAGIFMILQDHNVTAIDPLIEKYESELQHFDKDRYPWVKFVNSPLESYTCSTDFDVVFCMNGINHVARIEQAWNSISHMTSEGGILVMTVDAHKYSLLKYIFKWIPGDLLHPQQLDMNEYLNSIRKHGFHTEFTERIKKGKLFDHYFIVARKTQI